MLVPITYPSPDYAAKSKEEIERIEQVVRDLLKEYGSPSEMKRQITTLFPRIEVLKFFQHGVNWYLMVQPFREAGNYGVILPIEHAC